MDLVCCLANGVFFHQERSWVFRNLQLMAFIFLHQHCSPEVSALVIGLHSSVDDGVDICWSAVETHSQSL